jgi:hypothetical protein
VTDVLLIVVILAFFAAGAGLVRLLDRMIVIAGTDADPAGDDGSDDGGEPG